MAICIRDGLHFYPKSISIYYELQSGIRVKTLSCRNSLESSILNFERRDRLLALFGDPMETLWSCVFAMGFNFILRASQYIMTSIGHPIQTLWPSEFVWAFHVNF